MLQNSLDDSAEVVTEEFFWDNGLFGHCAVTVKDTQFLLFGCNGVAVLDTVISSKDGKKLTPLKIRGKEKPKARCRASAAVSDSNIFVFGGLDEKLKPLSDVWQFNAETLRWTQIHLVPGQTSPRPRFGHTCSIVNRNLYCFGGIVASSPSESPSTLVEEVWMLDLDLRQWSELTIFTRGAAPVPSAYHFSFAYNNDIFVLPGLDSHSERYFSSHKSVNPPPPSEWPNFTHVRILNISSMKWSKAALSGCTVPARCSYSCTLGTIASEPCVFISGGWTGHHALCPTDAFALLLPSLRVVHLGSFQRASEGASLFAESGPNSVRLVLQSGRDNSGQIAFRVSELMRSDITPSFLHLQPQPTMTSPFISSPSPPTLSVSNADSSSSPVVPLLFGSSSGSSKTSASDRFSRGLESSVSSGTSSSISRPAAASLSLSLLSSVSSIHNAEPSSSFYAAIPPSANIVATASSSSSFSPSPPPPLAFSSSFVSSSDSSAVSSPQSSSMVRKLRDRVGSMHSIDSSSSSSPSAASSPIISSRAFTVDHNSSPLSVSSSSSSLFSRPQSPLQVRRPSSPSKQRVGRQNSIVSASFSPSSSSASPLISPQGSFRVENSAPVSSPSPSPALSSHRQSPSVSGSSLSGPQLELPDSFSLGASNRYNARQAALAAARESELFSSDDDRHHPQDYLDSDDDGAEYDDEEEDGEIAAASSLAAASEAQSLQDSVSRPPSASRLRRQSSLILSTFTKLEAWGDDEDEEAQSVSVSQRMQNKTKENSLSPASTSRSSHRSQPSSRAPSASRSRSITRPSPRPNLELRAHSASRSRSPSPAPPSPAQTPVPEPVPAIPAPEYVEVILPSSPSSAAPPETPSSPPSSFSRSQPRLAMTGNLSVMGRPSPQHLQRAPLLARGTMHYPQPQQQQQQRPATATASRRVFTPSKAPTSPVSASSPAPAAHDVLSSPSSPPLPPPIHMQSLLKQEMQDSPGSRLTYVRASPSPSPSSSSLPMRRTRPQSSAPTIPSSMTSTMTPSPSFFLLTGKTVNNVNPVPSPIQKPISKPSAATNTRPVSAGFPRPIVTPSAEEVVANAIAKSNSKKGLDRPLSAMSAASPPPAAPAQLSSKQNAVPAPLSIGPLHEQPKAPPASSSPSPASTAPKQFSPTSMLAGLSFDQSDFDSSNPEVVFSVSSKTPPATSRRPVSATPASASRPVSAAALRRRLNLTPLNDSIALEPW